MKHLKYLILAVAALAFAAMPAKAQTTPNYQVLLTTSTNTVAGSSTNAIVTSQAFYPNSITGFAVVPNITLSGGASNVTFNFEPSLDGSNFATVTAPLSYVMAASGTLANVGFCNFPPNVSGSGSVNIPYWRLSSIATSGTGTVTLNAITISKTTR